MKVYLLAGKEDFLKDEFISKLRSELFKNADAGLNTQISDGELSGFGPALEFLQTAPFLASNRLAIVKNVEALEEDAQASLLRYVESPVPTGVLVLLSDAPGVKKDGFLQALSKKAQLVPCAAPYESELPSWIQSRAKAYGKSVNPKAQAVLVERVGKDVRGLDAALDQLAVYIDPRKEIEAGDVEKLLGRSAQADAFKLLDALVAGQPYAAFRVLTDLWKEGVKAPEIVGALSSQLERLRQVKALRNRGMGPEPIAAELKIHPFAAKMTAQQADRVPENTLVRWLATLLECDEALKTGKLEARLALEHFVLAALQRVDG